MRARALQLGEDGAHKGRGGGRKRQGRQLGSTGDSDELTLQVVYVCTCSCACKFVCVHLCVFMGSTGDSDELTLQVVCACVSVCVCVCLCVFLCTCVLHGQHW